MNELARGNPEMQAQEPSQHPAPDEKTLIRDYQNFDDFAQRSSQAKQGQLFNQPLIRSKMSWQRLIRSKSELILTSTKPKK